MVGTLLLRGMLVGVVAGLLCFAFLKVAGEPSVDRAIAFEGQVDAAKDGADATGATSPTTHQHGDEAELVSRPVQAGIGLLTGVVVYSAAVGGLFALAFALAHGRMGELGPRSTAALLAGVGFVAVYVMPTLKYPANPPAVGEAGTIGMRTGLYFAMLALSLAAAIGCGMLRRRLANRYGAWNAFLIGTGVYLAAMLAVSFLLPAINEVPEDFPAVVLWQFRIASLGAQSIMWATLGLLFGALTERAASPRRKARATATA